MAKRGATSDLNHDNWDREEEPEESGTFAKASEDALKKRVIKVAKRRNPISSVQQNEDEKTTAFGGFSGFNKTQSSSSNTSFGFLSNLTNKTNGTEDKTDKKLDEYYAKLKGLNESVTEWIKKHVVTNPLINLQPIFKDYDKYFNELEKLKLDLDKTEKSSTGVQFSFGSTTPPKFSFGNSQSTTGTTGFSFTSNNPTTVNSFSASSTTLTVSSSKPSFSFGSSTTNSDNSKFSFTSTVIKPADDVKNPSQEEEQEDDQPPKVDFVPVVEDGHVYSIRCKVFVKKDGSFADHGVGTLYLKPVPENKKMQLIVRAETNLGRLICNFILGESIPIQRMGKKDVMLVCIPNPDTQPPPVPILLRVKSTEDADELFKTLEKHKK